jgi:hypothetical protein
LASLDLAALLGPVAAAQDALARLDARTEAAPEPVREGLLARLALREAAGWLAALGCWVHPRDLALRTAHLIGVTELPNTAGHHWQDMDSTTRLLAEGHVATALAFARLLRHLARQPGLLDDGDAALAALAPLTGAADPSRFAAWRARWPDKSPKPALLSAALAAADWMEAGITDCPPHSRRSPPAPRCSPRREPCAPSPSPSGAPPRRSPPAIRTACRGSEATPRPGPIRPARHGPGSS